MRAAVLAGAVCVILALAGCGSTTTPSVTTTVAGPGGSTVVKGPGPDVSIPAGPPPRKLVVEDLRQGKGAKAKLGDQLTVRDVAVRYMTGEPFESNWGKGKKPFTFKLDSDEVSPGWVRGLQGMRAGGRRKLIVPTALTSRFDLPAGTGPEATLVYVIDLARLEDPRKHGEPALAPPSGPPPNHLVVENLVPGKGPKARPGDRLTVEYVGIHYDGSPFTDSWERAKPFSFRLGSQDIRVNPGWEKGLEGMRVGGRRELIVPPALLQRGGALPESRPRDALVYVVDLVGLRG